MHPRSVPATDRSTICGGYTEKVAGFAEDQRQARTASEGRFRVTLEPLDTRRAVAAVAAAGCGAVTTFIGLVRDHNAGRRVLYLDYECYEPLAVKSFQRIAAEAAERWPGVRLAIDHRVGPLQIGEASVVIAAASPHRAEAFAASRYAIERIKQIAPIWKREHFEGGDIWIEGATADPDNENARQQALARAGT
jgi:molybdopterin synthase catalytic subunit